MYKLITVFSLIISSSLYANEQTQINAEKVYKNEKEYNWRRANLENLDDSPKNGEPLNPRKRYLKGNGEVMNFNEWIREEEKFNNSKEIPQLPELDKNIEDKEIINEIDYLNKNELVNVGLEYFPQLGKEKITNIVSLLNEHNIDKKLVFDLLKAYESGAFDSLITQEPY